MRLLSIFMVLLVALIRSTEAQGGGQTLPSCTLNCLGLFIPQSSCLITDRHCICTNTALQANLTACVHSTCSIRDRLTSKNITSQMCDWPVHDKAPLIRRVIISSVTVSTLFYVTRMLARLPALGGELGSDDYMISAAYMFTLGHGITSLLVCDIGLGKDIWQIPHTHSNDRVTYLLQVWIAVEKFYILAVWLTKLSILLFYLRIFPDSQFRTKVKLCLAFCAATVFCLFFACLLKCWPVSFEWTYWDGEHTGSCSSQNAQGWANAALNIFGDLLVLSLPLRTLWQMSMSLEKRLSIMFMFGGGILITGVSLYRLKTLEVFTYSLNPTWDFVPLMVWSVIEVNLGIVCACLPGIRSFYNRIIIGRMLHKNRDARRPSKIGLAALPGKEASKPNKKPSVWGLSGLSDFSQATTLDESSVNLPKDCIFVVSDVEIEERSINTISDIENWSKSACGVEEWPVREERRSQQG